MFNLCGEDCESVYHFLLIVQLIQNAVHYIWSI